MKLPMFVITILITGCTTQPIPDYIFDRARALCDERGGVKYINAWPVNEGYSATASCRDGSSVSAGEKHG